MISAFIGYKDKALAHKKTASTAVLLLSLNVVNIRKTDSRNWLENHFLIYDILELDPEKRRVSDVELLLRRNFKSSP